MKYLFLLSFIVSCAQVEVSKQDTQKTTKRKISSAEEDFSWVEKLDFDKKSETKYVSDKDKFDFSNVEESNHALLNESLSSLSEAKLEEGLEKNTDPLSKMNIKCYQRKFEEAFKISDDIYSNYKNNTSYWNQIGTCYLLKLDYGKAILFYNKSIDLDSKFAPPVNNLGVVYERQGKFQKALAAFKMASNLNTFSSTPTYNLALLYLKFGTVGKSLPIFQGLLKRSPNDVSVQSAFASSLLIRGDLQGAIDQFSKIEKSALSNPTIGLNFAVALKLAGRPIDAKTVFANITQTTNHLSEYSQKVENFIRN